MPIQINASVNMKKVLYYDVMASPVGRILIGTTQRGLFSLHYPLRSDPSRALEPYVNRCGFSCRPSKAKSAGIRRQLTRYFQGRLRRFRIPLDLEGTPFQVAVWKELLRIPFGQTVSYGQLACRLGRPRAARAVGMANNRNKIGIVVPCHRVIGSNGNLVGYAAGLGIQGKLLRHEQAVLGSRGDVPNGSALGRCRGLNHRRFQPLWKA